ncbi:hypothetical protein LL912_00955 [Niabella sp. CC-SYL272]|uniref:hypothetical protein n=1 Tax=Niabella agricola TaxID=2891571 RepID=UPI001F1E21C7|nr:hypothetical protein [Niabella agricola]MCF3107336.1 hypothetical protein [Niabella agricola]
MKSIKVEYKKLGRQRVIGLAYGKERRIEIDERLTGEKFITTLIHEIMHIQNWHWDEFKVYDDAEEMGKIVYRELIKKGVIK